MKETKIDGLKRTDFISDEMEKKVVIKEQLDIESHLKANKELYTQNDGYNKDRTFKRVASIPILALQIWAEEYNGDNNWFSLPKVIQNKILKKKLNSNEYQYFKTAKGNL